MRNYMGRAVLIISTIALLFCSPNPNADTPRDVDTSQRTMRDFQVPADAVAARLFNAPSIDGDAQLARHYDETGYAPMARVLDGRRSPQRARVQWLCPVSDVAETQNEVNSIATLRKNGDYRAAAETAARALEARPESCRLQVEWALAVLRMATVDTASVQPDDLERAIRILVTASTEIVIIPEGYSGSSQVLYDVARAIRRQNPCAARNAYKWARELIENDRMRTTSEPMKQIFAELGDKIDQEIVVTNCAR